MTRVDFRLIAEAVKASYTPARTEIGRLHNAGVRDTALSLADALRSTNPRFDRAKFLTACGVEE